jgi:hypothetical protein
MNRKTKKNTGSATAELPVALLVIMLFALLPLIDMATLFMGSNSVVGSARNAVVAAARAQTFTTDVSPSQPSAINLAKQIANGYTSGSVHIDNVQVTAVAMPIQGGASVPIVPSATLAIDPTANIYQITVTVTGSVTPMLMLSSDLFGSVPGLTTPMVVTTSSSANYENPPGLAQ